MDELQCDGWENHRPCRAPAVVIFILKDPAIRPRRLCRSHAARARAAMEGSRMKKGSWTEVPVEPGDADP